MQGKKNGLTYLTFPMASAMGEGDGAKHMGAWSILINPKIK